MNKKNARKIKNISAAVWNAPQAIANKRVLLLYHKNGNIRIYGKRWCSRIRVSKDPDGITEPPSRISCFRIPLDNDYCGGLVMNWSEIVSDWSQGIGFPAVSRSGDISVSGCWKQCLSLGAFFSQSDKIGWFNFELPITFSRSRHLIKRQGISGRPEASKWTYPFFVQSRFYLDIPQVSHLPSIWTFLFFFPSPFLLRTLFLAFRTAVLGAWSFCDRNRLL